LNTFLLLHTYSYFYRFTQSHILTSHISTTTLLPALSHHYTQHISISRNALSLYHLIALSLHIPNLIYTHLHFFISSYFHTFPTSHTLRFYRFTSKHFQLYTLTLLPFHAITLSHTSQSLSNHLHAFHLYILIYTVSLSTLHSYAPTVSRNRTFPNYTPQSPSRISSLYTHIFTVSLTKRNYIFTSYTSFSRIHTSTFSSVHTCTPAVSLLLHFSHHPSALLPLHFSNIFILTYSRFYRFTFHVSHTFIITYYHLYRFTSSTFTYFRPCRFTCAISSLHIYPCRFTLLHFFHFFTNIHIHIYTAAVSLLLHFHTHTLTFLPFHLHFSHLFQLYTLTHTRPFHLHFLCIFCFTHLRSCRFTSYTFSHLNICVFSPLYNRFMHGFSCAHFLHRFIASLSTLKLHHHYQIVTTDSFACNCNY